MTVMQALRNINPSGHLDQSTKPEGELRAYLCARMWHLFDANTLGGADYAMIAQKRT